MFETIINFFKKLGKHETKETTNSKDKAKERLHLVLMQDRANVSADFLEMMKQEIIEVIKKYIEVEENAIDVRLTNEIKEDGTTGAPSLYANIPILNIRNEMKKEVVNKINKEEANKEKNSGEEKKQEDKKENTENKEESKGIVPEEKEEKNSEPEKNEDKEKKEKENLEENQEENKEDEEKETIEEESKEETEQKDGDLNQEEVKEETKKED